MSSEYILSVFITLITIIDPIGLIPIFLAVVPAHERKNSKAIILRSLLVAFFVSITFLFIGKTLFHYLQIQFDSVYLVGGILLFKIGLDMIYAKPRETLPAEEEGNKANHSVPTHDIAVYPLAIPMLAGPGTLAATIMFSSRYPTIENYFVIISALIVAFGLAGMAMFFSLKILRFLKGSGLLILDRVMGIILCSLAVQFITNAVIQIARQI